MEIRRWLYFISIKCLLIQYLSAKTVSLNEIIAAESQRNQVTETPPLSILKAIRPKSILLNEIITSESQENQESNDSPPIKHLEHSSLFRRLLSPARIKQHKPDSAVRRDTIISPLKYRKTFQIKSPLKPKKLKLALKSKRKSQSIKREISGNESLKQKYIPLLKSLSMLFDNLLNSDESEFVEIKTKKYKRHRFYSEEQFETPCNCSSSPNYGDTKSKPKKKTTTPSPSFSSEISSDTEDLALGANYDHSTYRPHKIVPVLLPRNTFSRRRNNYGPSKRSSSTYNRDIERNITRDNGDHEHNTGRGKNDSYAQSNENYTNGFTRSDSSSSGHRRTGRERNNTTNTENRKAIKGIEEKENANDTIGDNKLEIGRNKNEGEELLREPIRRLRGFISDDEITHGEGVISERVQSEEIREKSIFSTTYDSTSHKRITDKSGPFTTENEKVRPRNETVILIEKSTQDDVKHKKNFGKKSPVVLIFDGYSVTRDKNGENKVGGKTIHIRS